MQERLRRTGMGALSPAQGLAALGGLLSSANSTAPEVLAVTPVDWPTFLQRFASRAPPLFSEFAAQAHDEQPALSRTTAAQSQLAGPNMKTMTAAEVAAIVRDAVHGIAGRTFPDDEPLMAAGDAF